MAFRKLPTLGSRPADIADGLETVKKEISKPQTVAEYDAASGSNTVKHGMRSKPLGRQIIYCECTSIYDVSITETSWTFTAGSAGKVKVIWL